jgi:hypothetical protein
MRLQLKRLGCQTQTVAMAHHVDPRVDRYRRVTGRPCKIGETAIQEA